MAVNGADKRFWSAKEAAAYLSVTVPTLYHWLKTGTENESKKSNKPPKLLGPPPPFRRFGRKCIRFPIEEFVKWAEPIKEN